MILLPCSKNNPSRTWLSHDLLAAGVEEPKLVRNFRVRDDLMGPAYLYTRRAQWLKGNNEGG